MKILNELLGGVQTPQGLGENVVIEWGFVPVYLDHVRWLQDVAGLDPWWLDGDEAALRQGYIERHGDSPEMMELCWKQVEAIQETWPQLESFYGDHIIHTVTSGPTGPEYLPCAEIVFTMLPDDAEG